MTIAEVLAMELKQEATSTRKTLERVPLDHADYKPHEKSMSLRVLAVHVAEIFSWFRIIVHQPELDFATFNHEPFVPTTTEELVAFFDKNLADALDSLANIENNRFSEPWSMRQGEQIFFTIPKVVAIRTWCFSHMIHHRAQLGVYLRLLDIPVPGVYGPSADDHK